MCDGKPTQERAELRTRNGKLMRQLGSLNARSRRAGRTDFDLLPEPGKRAILHILLNSYPNLALSVLLTNFWCAALPLMISLLLSEALSGRIGEVTTTLITFVPLSLISTLVHLRKTALRLRTLAQLLDGSEDLRLIPTALATLGRSGEALYLPLTRFINRNLPGVTEETMESWSADERAKVLHILTLENRVPVPMLDEAMRLKGFELMGVLGDRKTLRVLEELALGFHCATTALRERAVETLPRLRARLERSAKGESLLRSSNLPINPESLVRPAGAGQESTTIDLLRPI